MNEKLIQSFMDVMPYLGEIFQIDCSIAVTTREKHLFVVSGNKVKSSVKSGDPNQTNEILENVLKSKKSFSIRTPPGYYSIPTKTLIYPVESDDGIARMVIAVTKDLENEADIEKISDSLFNSLEQLGKGVDEIALDSQSLATNVSEIITFVDQTRNKINEIDKIIQTIKDMASQSNLLSLNASIEAARAGQSGRGFSVVASEMGKLANISKESSGKVEKSLLEIKNAIETIGRGIAKIGATSENQAAATEEISATTSEIVHVSRRLTEISKNI